MTRCPCKVDFTPDGGDLVTLIDSGGWLARHPRWEAAQDLFEEDGILASEGYFSPLGGALVTMRLEVIDEQASIGAARDIFLDPAAGLMTATGTLVITGSAETATFSRAVVTAVTPRLPFGPEPAVSRVYEITAGVPEIAAT